jgi:hypothetical protein
MSGRDLRIPDHKFAKNRGKPKVEFAKGLSFLNLLRLTSESEHKILREARHKWITAS